MEMVFGDPRLPARFWAKIRVHPTLGCWEWIGARRNEYGAFAVSWDRKRTTVAQAHKHAFQTLIGPVPDGHELDHYLFDGPSSRCIGPTCALHVRPATPLENTMRSSSPASFNAAKEACPSGHPYTMVDSHGRRRCRDCKNATWRATAGKVRSKMGRLVIAALSASIIVAVDSPCFAGDAFLGRNWSRSYYAKDQDNGGSLKSDVAPAVAGNTNQGTNAATLPGCLNCDPPFIGVWGAMETVINGQSGNQLKPVGGIYLETPLTLGGDGTAAKPGTTLGRAFARLTVQPQPGASVPTEAAPTGTVLNFAGFEALAGAERVLGRSQGVTTGAIAAVWLGTRFSHDPAPLDNMKTGWGIGIKVRHTGGSYANGVCGTDSSIGDDGAVQCRTWGRLVMPKTKAIGSVYFDALMSFFQPQALDAAGQPIVSTSRHVMVLLGIGVNADAIFAAFKS